MWGPGVRAERISSTRTPGEGSFTTWSERSPSPTKRVAPTWSRHCDAHPNLPICRFTAFDSPVIPKPTAGSNIEELTDGLGQRVSLRRAVGFEDQKYATRCSVLAGSTSGR